MNNSQIENGQPTLKQHNVMQRVAVVECCWQCPHHIHDDGNDESKWGKHWCNKLDVEIVDADTIPNDCPLPFA
jgi:hypothetical protein